MIGSASIEADGRYSGVMRGLFIGCSSLDLRDNSDGWNGDEAGTRDSHSCLPEFIHWQLHELDPRIKSKAVNLNIVEEDLRRSESELL